MLFSVRKQYFFTHNQILEIQKENRRLKKLGVTGSQTVDDVEKYTSNKPSIIVFAVDYYSFSWLTFVYYGKPSGPHKLLCLDYKKTSGKS